MASVCPKKLIAYVRDLADLKDEANFGYLPPGLLRALSGDSRKERHLS